MDPSLEERWEWSRERLNTEDTYEAGRIVLEIEIAGRSAGLWHCREGRKHGETWAESVSVQLCF